MRIPTVAFFSLMLVGAVVLGQSRSTLRDRYGSPVAEIYQTPKNLMITASFADNGSLCSARIEAEGRRMKDAELDTVLDDLAPKDARGKYIIGTFLDVICPPDNNCAGVSEDYERVTVTKIGNTNDYKHVQLTYKTPECKTKPPHRGM